MCMTLKIMMLVPWLVGYLSVGRDQRAWHEWTRLNNCFYTIAFCSKTMIFYAISTWTLCTVCFLRARMLFPLLFDWPNIILTPEFMNSSQCTYLPFCTDKQTPVSLTNICRHIEQIYIALYEQLKWQLIWQLIWQYHQCHLTS